MMHELKDFEGNIYDYDPLFPETIIKHFGAKPFPKLDKMMGAVIIAFTHSVLKEMGGNEELPAYKFPSVAD